MGGAGAQVSIRIYGFAFHYVHNQDEARDLAQDIFVRIYRRLGTFQGNQAFLPWMLRVACNVCIDHLRRRTTRPPRSDRRVEDGCELADSRRNPQEQTISLDRRRLIQRALRRLSRQNREMILLKDIQGLNLREIADLLAVPLGTVKSRSSRARVELARTILGMDPSYGCAP